jgi:hypothetical protein
MVTKSVQPVLTQHTVTQAPLRATNYHQSTANTPKPAPTTHVFTGPPPNELLNYPRDTKYSY